MSKRSVSLLVSIVPLENLQDLSVGKYRVVKSGEELTAEFELK